MAVNVHLVIFFSVSVEMLQMVRDSRASAPWILHKRTSKT